MALQTDADGSVLSVQTGSLGDLGGSVELGVALGREPVDDDLDQLCPFPVSAVFAAGAKGRDAPGKGLPWTEGSLSVRFLSFLQRVWSVCALQPLPQLPSSTFLQSKPVSSVIPSSSSLCTHAEP